MHKLNLFFAICLLNSACAPNANRELPSSYNGLNSDTVELYADGKWSKSQFNSGNSELIVHEMTDPEQEKWKRLLGNLHPRPISNTLGLTIFQEVKSPELMDSVFVVPRLYAVGSADGARIHIQHETADISSVTFPIILTDGLVSSIPYGSGFIRLPDELVIGPEKRAALTSDLIRETGGFSNWSVASACPEKILIKVGNREYDVTPRVEGQPRCQVNQPIQVTYRNDRESVKRFLSEEILNGHAELITVFRVAGSFISQVYRYQVDRSEWHRSMDARTLPDRLYTGAEVVKLVRAQLQEEINRFPLHPVAMDGWEAVVSAGVHQTFERTEEPECQEVRDCFRLRPAQKRESGPWAFSLFREQRTDSNRKVLSSASFRPLVDTVGVALPGESRSNLDLPAYRGVVQDYMNVSEGDVLELRLSHLVLHELEYPFEEQQAQVSHLGEYCADKIDVCTPKMEDQFCKVWSTEPRCVNWETRCVEMKPRLDCTTNCTTVKECDVLIPFLNLCIHHSDRLRCNQTCSTRDDPNFCVKTQRTCSQFQPVCLTYEQKCEEVCREKRPRSIVRQQYSDGVLSQRRVIESPIGRSDQNVLDGIEVRLIDSSGRARGCPLRNLKHQIVGQSVEFIIQNHGQCRIFGSKERDENTDSRPVLQLVNKIGTQRTVQCGAFYADSSKTQHYYYGCGDWIPGVGSAASVVVPKEGSPVPLYRSYYPRVDIHGALILKTGTFGVANGSNQPL